MKLIFLIAEEIGEEALLEIDIHSVKELITPIGKRLIFIKHLENFKKLKMLEDMVYITLFLNISIWKSIR